MYVWAVVEPENKAAVAASVAAANGRLENNILCAGALSISQSLSWVDETGCKSSETDTAAAKRLVKEIMSNSKARYIQCMEYRTKVLPA